MKNPTVEILIAIQIYKWQIKHSMIKTELLTHAWGNLSARDSVEDEESPNSCEDDTISESSDSEPFFQGAGGGRVSFNIIIM